MAKAVVTIKLMPESPETDLSKIESVVNKKIDEFTGDNSEKRFEMEPVAFGLKALNVKFIMDEDIGSTEDLEKVLADLDEVNSVDVIDVRRTLG